MSTIPLDDVMYFDVTTHDPATGAVTDADSPPTFDVFEESTDTPILDDQTMTKRTSLTGNYRGSITLSAANGFEAGKWYSVIVSATVAAITAKDAAKQFRIGPAESVAGVPKVDVSHAAGTAWGSGAITAAAIAADAITDAKVASDVTIAAVTGAVGSVTGNVGGNVGGSVGSVTAGVTLADGALTAAKIGADAITAAKVAADVTTEIQAGLATASSLATVAGFVDTEVGAIKAVTDKLDTMLEADGGVSRFTANAVEEAPSGTGASAASIRAEIDANSTQLAAIKAKTDGLPSDPADQSLVIDATTAIMTRLGAPAGASVSADVAAVKAQTAAIEADTQDLQAQVGTDGAGLTAIGDTRLVNLDAAVSSRLPTGGYTAPPTAIQNADALLDRANAVEMGVTPRGYMRAALAALAGELSGAGTSEIVIANPAGTSTRITATVTEDGDRTTIVLSLS